MAYILDGDGQTTRFPELVWGQEQSGGRSAKGLAAVRPERRGTYLFDLEYQDVKPPLSQFQHSRTNEDDTRKLVADINKHLGDAALSADRLTVAFDKWWPDLEAKLASVPAPKVKLPRQSDPEKLAGMVAEILNAVREQSRLLQQMAPLVETSAVNVAEPSARNKSVRTWSLFRSLLEARGHEVSLEHSSHGLDVIVIDGEKVIPVTEAWNMLNPRRNLGQIGRDRAEMLEDLVNRYPIHSEKPESTPPLSDV